MLAVPYKGTAHKLQNTALFTLLDALQVVAAALGGKVGSNPSGDFVLTGVTAHAQASQEASVSNQSFFAKQAWSPCATWHLPSDSSIHYKCSPYL